MSEISVARTLARFLEKISCDTLDTEIISRAKNLILDALGCSVGGIEEECSRIALRVIETNRGDCTVFGMGIKAPLQDAAFANAVSTNALSLDDFLYTFHPGTINVPTAFAIAEKEGLSGSELIGSIVAGYEVMGRMYLGGPTIAPKFRATSVYGPFGTTVTAGKLYQFDEELLMKGICYAANFGSGLTQCWLNGTLEGYFHPGMSARDGILAASLVKEKARAAEFTLEGRQGFYLAYAGNMDEIGAVTADLGSKYMIMNASFKQYPICALLQIPIDFIEKLKKQHNISAKKVSNIVIEVSEWDANFPGSNYDGPFENVGQTLLSSQFCTAAALLNHPVWAYDFYPKNFSDPDIAALAKKIKLVGKEGREFPLITVNMEDGETYRMEADEQTDSLIPTPEKTHDKFMNLTTGFLGEERAKEIVDMVSRLEEIADIRELTGKFIKD
ncbi:MAG: MmgE/PrpD family protein [Deltaproteobacteria bacterium]|nr:MmgE/PrpD family protein [Deltaproteobacteria bacterium]